FHSSYTSHMSKFRQITSLKFQKFGIKMKIRPVISSSDDQIDESNCSKEGKFADESPFIRYLFN
ncbi:hypothetical protein, partial [Bacillus pumilus]|uniref:hypothetical protein n=1 Tax=Bacillus pumilus TaxID=1408 RepID=UPI001BAA4B27